MTDATQHEGTQFERVLAALRDGSWRTLPELHAATGDPVASISAQIRAARTIEGGSHTIVKRRRGRSESGLYEYRLFSRDSGPESAA